MSAVNPTMKHEHLRNPNDAVAAVSMVGFAVLAATLRFTTIDHLSSGLNTAPGPRFKTWV